MSTRPISLDAFDLIEEIGSGASGRVWSATHRDSGDSSPKLAVKILSGPLAQNKQWIAAFRREVQAVASLDHPNIVRVYDHGRVPSESPFGPNDGIGPNSPYLAMEHLGGGTLTSRAGRLHWADLQAVLLTMLDALAHAHARGVLHRDIKPSNLMIGASGVTVTDFGIGFILTEDNPATDRLLGTPAYMAPEQFQCRWRDYGPWTDLYSVGCTGYALASARPPFGAGLLLEESMEGHLFSPPPDLEARIEVPQGFEDWLRRLMRKSPANRFQCAADAAWALSSLKLPKGSPEAFRPPSAELSALGFSTLDLPSEVPTDLLSSYTFGRPEVEPAPDDPKTRPNFAPPCPDHWRRNQDSSESQQLDGVGLELYGLRSIPLVDREEERTELWSALREVHRLGTTKIVVLRGGGGSGKSRLARWLCERATESGAARTLRAMHSATPGPGQGLAAMFTRRFGCGGLGRSEAAERLTSSWTAPFALSPEETQGLADYLYSDAEEEDRTVGFEGTRFQSPAERNTVLERLVRTEAKDRPVVVWLDDVHYGLDSLFFVLHLLAHQDDYPLPCLLVLTVRDDLLDERPVEEELLRQILELDPSSSVSVGPLDEADRPALVRELLGLKGDLARRVEERSGGNPLFAIQLVGDWVQRGILVPSASGFQILPNTSLQIPDTIHDIWTERIDRLLAGRPDSDVAALEVAATLGQQVDWGEWQLACKELDATASTDLVDALIALRLADLPLSGNERGWTFVHGLLRESLKRRAEEGGRAQEQHRACANLLRNRSGLDAVARCAQHLLGAGDLREGIITLARCAGGFVESGELKRAEEALNDRDRATDQLGLPPEAEERIDTLLTRSFLARAGKELLRSIQFAMQAESLARTLGSPRRVARAIRARGTGLGEMGQLEESERAQREAALLAAEAGDLQCLAAAKRGRGAALTELGDSPGARVELEEALALYRALGDDYGVTVCLIGLSRTASFEENYGEVRDLVQEAASAAHRLGFRSLLVDCANQLGEAARGLGRLDLAEKHYREALRLAHKLPSYAWVGTFEVNLGLLLAGQNRWEEALNFYRTGAKSLRESTGDVQAAMADFFALTCLAALGRWADWTQLCGPATDAVTTFRTIEPDLARSAYKAAEFALEADRLDAARASLEFAAAQWVALGNESEEMAVRDFLASLEST